MFDIGYSELLLIAIVALLAIGPKELPRAMRTVGGWVGKGRAMTRHVRAGFDTMMREAELDEMQKIWDKQNADIMRATPLADEWIATPNEASPVEAIIADATPGPVKPATKPRARKPRTPRTPEPEA